MDDVIAAHNVIRSGLGSQPIIWDESLAKLARDEVRKHLIIYRVFEYGTLSIPSVPGLYIFRHLAVGFTRHVA